MTFEGRSEVRKTLKDQHMSVNEPSSRPLPTWFDEAKFGIMVIWIPAAVPAFAPVTTDLRGDHDFLDESFDDEKYLRDLPYAEMYFISMHIEGSPTSRHHAERYGNRPYDEFVKEFREGLARWDPEPWADLFAAAGAKYVIFTAKHQDGFLLWPSERPHPHKMGWQAERDVVGELAAAVRARGMRFGALYNGGTDLTFGRPFANFEAMTAAIPQDQEYANYVDGHWRELIERYELDVLSNDMGYSEAANPAALVDWYRKRVPDGVTNDRFRPNLFETPSDAYTDFVTLEYQDYEKHAPVGRKWEACRGIGNSFGYNREETEAHYSSSAELIHELCDVVARGGNLLLDVGPTAIGRVPWPQAKRLLELGWWLRENGDAIYKSLPWSRPTGATRDQLDVRYTQTEAAVYAITLAYRRCRDRARRDAGGRRQGDADRQRRHAAPVGAHGLRHPVRAARDPGTRAQLLRSGSPRLWPLSRIRRSFSASSGRRR
jgi:alpha-L-fucosidase